MIELRASGAARWVNCPAAPRMEAPIPDRESEDAREGTAAHWLAAQVLGGHVSSVEELTDRTAPNGVIISGEMVEHAQTYIDAVRSVTVTPVVERPMPIMPGVRDGTPDALFVENGRTAHLWDLKYGYRIVEARGNWQLFSYAVALFFKFPQLQSVTAHIVQPRPWHPEGRVRSWTIGAAEMQHLWPIYNAAVTAAHAPDAETRAGPHCNYCRALHLCPAARQAALNGVDLAAQGQAENLPPDALAGELRTLRRASKAIKLRLDAIEADAMSRIDGGAILPGFEIDRAMGRRRWKDGFDPKTLEALTGLSLTEIKPVSPAQAEKAGADKAMVRMFTTTPETGRKLVERDNGAKAREVFK